MTKLLQYERCSFWNSKMLVIKFYHKYKNYKYKKRQKELKKEYPTSNVGSYASVSGTKLEGYNVINDGVNVNKSVVGFGTVIGGGTNLSNSLIGRFCSIAGGIHIVTPTHPLDMVSTYPGFFNTCNNYPFGKSKTRKDEFLHTSNGFSVEIGNDVWIGEGVTFKGGVCIGDGAVIGMNATVTKDVPPYAIVGGVPARIIKYRMNEEQIKKMLEIKWWDWSPDLIKQRREEFSDIQKFILRYGK